jgi:hypothetical protein
LLGGRHQAPPEARGEGGGRQLSRHDGDHAARLVEVPMPGVGGQPEGVQGLDEHRGVRVVGVDVDAEPQVGVHIGGQLARSSCGELRGPGADACLDEPVGARDEHLGDVLEACLLEDGHPQLLAPVLERRDADGAQHRVDAHLTRRRVRVADPLAQAGVGAGEQAGVVEQVVGLRERHDAAGRSGLPGPGRAGRDFCWAGEGRLLGHGAASVPGWSDMPDSRAYVPVSARTSLLVASGAAGLC